MISASKKLVDLFGDVVKADVIWTPDPSILACANVPKPMHGTNPRTVLGQSWWNVERRAAYERTNFHCAACGVHKYDAKARQWLEGHEKYTIDYARGLMTYVRTDALCHYCHNYCHDGRMKALLDIGKLHHAKYAAIIQHGDRILAAAGLRKPTYEGPFADWGKWRLVIGRTRYEGLFKSAEEWVEFHRKKNTEDS